MLKMVFFRDESLQAAGPPLRPVGTPSSSDESSKTLAPGAPWRPEATRSTSPRRCLPRDPIWGGRREAAAPQVRGRRRHRPTGSGRLTGCGRAAAPPCPAMDYAGLAEAAAVKIGLYRRDPGGWRGCRSTVSPGRDVRWGGIGAGRGTGGSVRCRLTALTHPRRARLWCRGDPRLSSAATCE